MLPKRLNYYSNREKRIAKKFMHNALYLSGLKGSQGLGKFVAKIVNCSCPVVGREQFRKLGRQSSLCWKWTGITELWEAGLVGRGRPTALRAEQLAVRLCL